MMSRLVVKAVNIKGMIFEISPTYACKNMASEGAIGLRYMGQTLINSVHGFDSGIDEEDFHYRGGEIV
ncbi:hypothetical protein OIU77_018734 [Salix suchowensis]|uniref:Uncharacterized protein n=1 Tax=Salix suchowensis TaxID=1278906 RepID=A0ABQ9CHH4_9ROSI|nr:hypothetical protein OIU77_018734 [Salix suchowensis]